MKRYTFKVWFLWQGVMQGWAQNVVTKGSLEAAREKAKVQAAEGLNLMPKDVKGATLVRG